MDCNFLVSFFALIAYLSLIASILTGLLLNLFPIAERWVFRIKKYTHIFFGLSLITFSYLHIYKLQCTQFDFRKIFDPIHYFDILAFLGILGLFLIIFTILSSFLRKHLNKIWWNNLHNLNYLTYLVITIHAVFKANDLWGNLFQILAFVSAVLILILFLFRIKKGNKLFM